MWNWLKKIFAVKHKCMSPLLAEMLQTPETRQQISVLLDKYGPYGNKTDGTDYITHKGKKYKFELKGAMQWLK